MSTCPSCQRPLPENAAGPDRLNRRSPGLAAAINFFVPGLGYLYAGRFRRFEALLLTGSVLTYISVAMYIVALGYDPVLASQPMRSDEWVAIPASLMISLAFAVDAYDTAKRMRPPDPGR